MHHIDSNTNLPESGQLTRKFYTMIPNIVDDLPLSVYAKALYLHIKRVAGENGACWQSVRTMAEHLKISVGMVVKSKRELEDNGLIIVEEKYSERGGNRYHSIRIVDIWDLNVSQYINTSPAIKSSPSEHPVSPHEHPVLPGELKNNPSLISNKTGKERPRRRRRPRAGDPDLVFDDIQNHTSFKLIHDLTGYWPPKPIWGDIDALGDLDEARVRLVFREWVAAGYNPQNFKGWLFGWYLNGIPDSHQANIYYFTEFGDEFPYDMIADAVREARYTGQTVPSILSRYLAEGHSRGDVGVDNELIRAGIFD